MFRRVLTTLKYDISVIYITNDMTHIVYKIIDFSFFSPNYLKKVVK